MSTRFERTTKGSKGVPASARYRTMTRRFASACGLLLASLTISAIAAPTFTLVSPLAGGFCQITDVGNGACRIAWTLSNVNASMPPLLVNVSATPLPAATNANVFTAANVNSSTTFAFASPTRGPYQLTIIDAATGAVLSSSTFNVVAVVTGVPSPSAGAILRATSLVAIGIQWSRQPSANAVGFNIGYSTSADCNPTGGAYAPIATAIPLSRVAGSTPFTYTWTVPANVSSSLVFICVADAAWSNYTVASASVQLEQFSTAWANLRGTWRGTETMATLSPITGECQTFTCDNVIISVTDSQIQQTYPLNSPCGSGTLVAPLSAASYDAVNGIVKSDKSGKYSRVVVDATSATLSWSYLSNALTGPPPNSTPMPSMGCGAGQLASSSLFAKDSDPTARLLGQWTGTVSYAIPDVQGVCKTGSCTSSLTFTRDQITLVWPALCGAGTGTTSAAFDSSQYDGVFYKSAGTGTCTRLEVVGGTLYRSQAQTSNLCPLVDNPMPSCDNGANFIWEAYTRGAAGALRPTLVATTFVALLVAFALW